MLDTSSRANMNLSTTKNIMNLSILLPTFFWTTHAESRGYIDRFYLFYATFSTSLNLRSYPFSTSVMWRSFVKEPSSTWIWTSLMLAACEIAIFIRVYVFPLLRLAEAQLNLNSALIYVTATKLQFSNKSHLTWYPLQKCKEKMPSDKIEIKIHDFFFWLKNLIILNYFTHKLYRLHI